jgi:hypothetical protein
MQVWNINETQYDDELIKLIRENLSYSSKTHILDYFKSEYSVLEAYVYDIATFHFNRLAIDNITDHYIEFWVKDKYEPGFHVDCDESLRKLSIYSYPLLSCVTYLNDNLDTPTIITNIDIESYKYKRFEDQTELFLSLPVKNKQITFDGKNFHGCASINDNIRENERFIIVMNLWNIKPNDVEYFNVDNINTKISRDIRLITVTASDIEIKNQLVCDNIINYDLFNDILYNNDFLSFNKFTLLNTDTSFKFTLDKTIKIKEHENSLKKKFGNVIDDYTTITNKTISLTHNRFFQRFVYKNIYTTDMCRYIIKECEKHAEKNNGWTTKRHSFYPTTDLPVENVKPIVGIVFETLETILNKIKVSYGLTNSDIKFDVIDLFVVKYSHDAQNQLDMHCDGSFISFGILLSDTNDFEGGGTQFDDELKINLDQGDVLIHSGLIKHSGLKISRGTRYVLVGFINITFTL